MICHFKFAARWSRGGFDFHHRQQLVAKWLSCYLGSPMKGTIWIYLLSPQTDVKPTGFHGPLLKLGSRAKRWNQDRAQRTRLDIDHKVKGNFFEGKNSKKLSASVAWKTGDKHVFSWWESKEEVWYGLCKLDFELALAQILSPAARKHMQLSSWP